jgi:hypothetical protein
LGSSAGSAAAVLVKALRTMKARMGDRSSVPPSGGMMPRKMFRYGSHIVLHKNATISETSVVKLLSTFEQLNKF